MTPDVINGLFEFVGGCMILLSVFRLYRDKQVKGVSWFAILFFNAWGYWNLFYYPHLDQWWSFFGGVFLVSVNSVWLVMMAYYIRREKQGMQQCSKSWSP